MSITKIIGTAKQFYSLYRIQFGELEVRFKSTKKKISRRMRVRGGWRLPCFFSAIMLAPVTRVEHYST